MKLAFYYHTPYIRKNNKLYLPGYIAVFLNSLSNQVDELILFLHESINKSIEGHLEINNSNINLVDLGYIMPAWYRSIFYSRYIKIFLKNNYSFDFLLIRAPSPLAPFFVNNKKLSNRISYFIVGDYLSIYNRKEKYSFREYIIKLYIIFLDKAFMKAINDKLLFVNSKELYNKYNLLSKKTILLKTTTLNENDFWERRNLELSLPIKLCYVGRFEIQKGLIELILAFIELRKIKTNIELHLVGWVDDKSAFESEMKSLIKKNNLESYVYWHGRKYLGYDLFKYYQFSDMFIIPSYHEGFPRVIWESMANSCPVIATNVGGIPDYLIDGYNCLLIRPQNINDIVYAVLKLINNNKLRIKVIKNGFNLSKNNTLFNQNSILIENINGEINSM